MIAAGAIHAFNRWATCAPFKETAALILPQPRYSPTESIHVASHQPSRCGSSRQPRKVTPSTVGYARLLARVYRQTLTFQALFHSFLRLLQHGLVRVEEQQIIHLMRAGARPQAALHGLVQRVQVGVRHSKNRSQGALPPGPPSREKRKESRE